MPTDKEIEAATDAFEESMVGTKTVNELVGAILTAAEKVREEKMPTDKLLPCPGWDIRYRDGMPVITYTSYEESHPNTRVICDLLCLDGAEDAMRSLLGAQELLKASSKREEKLRAALEAVGVKTAERHNIKSNNHLVLVDIAVICQKALQTEEKTDADR